MVVRTMHTEQSGVMHPPGRGVLCGLWSGRGVKILRKIVGGQNESGTGVKKW